jgi:hypothetical protein
MRTSSKFCSCLASLALAIVLTGCVTPHKMATPYNEADFQPFDGTGTSTITGQAFLKTVGGDVKYGAGNTVSLMPVTRYTMEAWTAARSGKAPQTDLRLQAHIRKAVADATGNFEFRNIPAGEYYIECPIFWGVAMSYGVEQTGAVVGSKTQARPGETVKIILTQ